jgi:hypothetical protein
MSKAVILQGRESERLTVVEERFQASFEKSGGQGSWEEAGMRASKKVSAGEPLTEEEQVARNLGIAYYGAATRIHNEVYKAR